MRFCGKAMNTDIVVAGLNPAAAVESFKWFQEIEQEFSRFLPDSEVSRVNQQAGRETQVSERFIRLLAEALEYVEQTEGLFSPFLESYMDRIGYSQTFERMNSASNTCVDQTEDRGVPAEEQNSGNTVVVNLESRKLTIHPQALLDLGGFAKGWSVQHIAMRMSRKFPDKGLIDAGGDMMACGNFYQQHREAELA